MKPELEKVIEAYIQTSDMKLEGGQIIGLMNFCEEYNPEIYKIPGWYSLIRGHFKEIGWIRTLKEGKQGGKQACYSRFDPSDTFKIAIWKASFK